MKRTGTLLTLVLLTVALAAAPAHAGESCHTINAHGTGEEAPLLPDDPPGTVRTVAQIQGGGLLQGTTDAVFSVTGLSETGLTFAGTLTFTTNRSTLTVETSNGTLDFATGVFHADTTVIDATGKLAGATGMLTFDGVQNLATGEFTETVVGEICVDLGGNGRGR